MRFISHIKNFGVGIFPKREEVMPGGVVRVVQEPLLAAFKQGDLHAEEIEAAERKWPRLPGRTYEADEVTPTNIMGRLSVYDTEDPLNVAIYERFDREMAKDGNYLPDGRTPFGPGSTQAWVESVLLAKAAVEIDFFCFEAPPVQAPWPLYDDFPGTPEDLVEVLLIQGHSLQQAIAYERQNQNRLDVIVLIAEKIAEEARAVEAPLEEFVTG